MLTEIDQALSCGVLVHGVDRRVVDANRAALRLVGLTRAQLLGRDPLPAGWSALEDGTRETGNPPLARLAEDPPRSFTLHVGGAGAWLDGASIPVVGTDGQRRVVCTLVEHAAGNPAADAEAIRRLDRLRALRSSAIAMNASHDTRLTLNVIAQQAVIHLGVSAAAIVLLDRAAGVLQYAEGVGFRRPGITRTRLALGEGYLGRAGLQRRWVTIPDLAAATDFIRTGLLVGEDFVSYFAVPLITRSELLGVLELFHRGTLIPDDEWLEFVETLAAQAATALENARLRERLGGSPPGGAGPRAAPALTRAEAAILRLLAGGHSNRAIAERAFVSENTVKYHLRRLYQKLGVRSRAGAIAVASTRGWL